jgi:hypothetical protein
LKECSIQLLSVFIFQSEALGIPESRETQKTSLPGAQKAPGQKRKSPIMKIADKIMEGLKFVQQKSENQTAGNGASTTDESIDSDNNIKNVLQFSKGCNLTHSVSTPDLLSHPTAHPTDSGHLSGIGGYSVGEEMDRSMFQFSSSCPLDAFLDPDSGETESYDEEEEELLRRHRQFWMRYKDMKSPKQIFDEAEGQKLSQQLVALLGKRARSTDFESFGEKVSNDSGVKLYPGEQPMYRDDRSVSNTNLGSEVDQGLVSPQLLNHGHGWSSQQSIRVKTGDIPVNGVPELGSKIRINQFNEDWSSSDDDCDDDNIDPDHDFQFFEDVFKIKKLSSLHRSEPVISSLIEGSGIGSQKKAVSSSVAGLGMADVDGDVGQGHQESGIVGQGHQESGIVGQGHRGSSIVGQGHQRSGIVGQGHPGIVGQGHQVSTGQLSLNTNVGHSKQSSVLQPADSGKHSELSTLNQSNRNITEKQDDNHRHNTTTQPTPQNGVQNLLESFHQNGLNPVLTSDLLLPISSSFLDTFIAIHRYIRFGRFLFEILLPLPKTRSRKVDQLGPFYSEMLVGREKVYEKFVKVSSGGTIYISTEFRPVRTSNMAARWPSWKTNKVLLLLN